MPLIAHAIGTAKDSGLFEHVFVSTEDAEIADVARKYGAEVITRPAEIAQDRSTVVQVCLHALATVPDIQILCCIYATAVFLKSSTLLSSCEQLMGDSDADFVMGVSEYEHHPVQALKADAQGNLSYMWPEWRGIQSQQYPNLVVSNGTFYWARREALIREKTFYGQRLKGFVIPAEQVSDIDTAHDLDRIVQRLKTH
jgi:CMP-N-acetylneuraminic acid synthetase